MKFLARGWSRLRTWLFMPLLLWVLWLLLNGSASPRSMALGAALAVLASVFSSAMRPVRARLKKPLLALRLAAVVLHDMTLSNLVVARVIWGAARRRQRTAFVAIPLQLRDPHGLSVLAMIITFIPGTVWSDLTDDGTVLTLHVLELRDDADWPQFIKSRYEQPLMEIFE